MKTNDQNNKVDVKAKISKEGVEVEHSSTGRYGLKQAPIIITAVALIFLIFLGASMVYCISKVIDKITDFSLNNLIVIAALLMLIGFIVLVFWFIADRLTSTE